MAVRRSTEVSVGGEGGSSRFEGLAVTPLPGCDRVSLPSDGRECEPSSQCDE